MSKNWQGLPLVGPHDPRVDDDGLNDLVEARAVLIQGLLVVHAYSEAGHSTRSAYWNSAWPPYPATSPLDYKTIQFL